MQDINDTIYDNIGLVITQLKRLSLQHDQDAESLGYEALYNAITTFDEAKGYKLSTYATCCIYNALGSYIRTLNKKRQLEVMSYNNTAYSEDGVLHEFVDFIASGSTTEEDFLRCELCKKVQEVYLVAFNKLTNVKHKAIIQLWHDSEYEMACKEVAKHVGVSQPYVSQVIGTFKYSVKQKLEEYYNE